MAAVSSSAFLCLPCSRPLPPKSQVGHALARSVWPGPRRSACLGLPPLALAFGKRTAGRWALSSERRFPDALPCPPLLLLSSSSFPPTIDRLDRHQPEPTLALSRSLASIDTLRRPPTACRPTGIMLTQRQTPPQLTPLTVVDPASERTTVSPPSLSSCSCISPFRPTGGGASSGAGEISVGRPGSAAGHWRARTEERPAGLPCRSSARSDAYEWSSMQAGSERGPS